MANKYFWFKMPGAFFEQNYVKILRAKENGNDMTLFYIWMLAESVDHEATLRYSSETAYDVELLSCASGFPEALVEESLRLFQKIDLIKIAEDGTIFMVKGKDMVGSESTSASRMRKYRERHIVTESDENLSQSDTGLSQSDIEIEIEKEKEIEKDINNTSGNSSIGTKKKPSPPYESIINLLNAETGKKFRANNKRTRELINARFAEGFTLEDFSKVISWKCKQWGNDETMKLYLRPETLFSLSKFESYLNEVPEIRPTTDKKIPADDEVGDEW